MPRAYDDTASSYKQEKSKMKLKKIWITTAAAALYGALPAHGQTIVTVKAEAMSLSSYAVENGNRIKLVSSSRSGSASKSFAGGDGKYNIQVYVVAENDGQSTLEVYRGTTLLRKYTYPLTNSSATFTISNVDLKKSDTIKLVGRPGGGALARVDKVVFTQVSPATTTGTTTSTTTGTTTGTGGGAGGGATTSGSGSGGGVSPWEVINGGSAANIVIITRFHPGP